MKIPEEIIKCGLERLTDEESDTVDRLQLQSSDLTLFIYDTWSALISMTRGATAELQIGHDCSRRVSTSLSTACLCMQNASIMPEISQMVMRGRRISRQVGLGGLSELVLGGELRVAV